MYGVAIRIRYDSFISDFEEYSNRQLRFMPRYSDLRYNIRIDSRLWEEIDLFPI